MQFLTLEQLQQDHAAGRVDSITLQADGAGFEVQIVAGGGLHRLARRFTEPGEALQLLRDAGISDVHIAGNDAASHAIRKALSGLEDGSNTIYAPDDWELLRTNKRMQRDAP
ncbi:hypothetical protein [Pseudoduganella aquatica]|uniref:Uncharacterized protein n=1 Tax=Pseudoduganella aquatica TaxID=2660641 RepID=A0A7X4HAW2_9BURK|nr:hypothetical protein [Pseudoduganella aquatica]MYN07192.1 hypothetical protein [Pseudoduganella aquatica]